MSKLQAIWLGPGDAPTPHIRGRRDPESGRCIVHYDEKCVRMGRGGVGLLDPRYDLWNHSPDGFEWGYGGSGPAQLALAILCAVLKDDDEACRLKNDFKFEVLSGLNVDQWSMRYEDVLAWARDKGFKGTPSY